MPSLKSRILSFVLRRTRKRSFTSVEGLRARIETARNEEDYTPPESLRGRVDINERRLGAMPVFDVKAKGISPDECIIYLHGGAFLFEITPHHWNLIAELAERLSVQISVAIFPLAPENKAPAIIDACLSLYRDKLQSFAPERIFLMGDSAGASLALITAMTAASADLAKPGRMVLISPALDWTMSNPDIAAVEKKDPWLATIGVREAARLYGDDLALDDWRISPIYGDVSVLPDMILLTGTHDILNPDAYIFAEKARAAGVSVELVEGSKMFHVWPLIDVPEGRQARDKIVEYLT